MKDSSTQKETRDDKPRFLDKLGMTAGWLGMTREKLLRMT